MTTSHKSAGGGTSSGNAVQTGIETAVPLAGPGASISTVASPRRRAPRLVVRPTAGLSFKTDTWTARGRWVARNDFDVPLEDHRAGFVRGFHLAGELLQALKAGTVHSCNISSIIQAAGRALDCRGREKSRSYAAHSFIRVLSGMVAFAAQHAHHEAYVSSAIASQLKDHEFLDAYREQLRREFIARMAAGKRAKKEAAQLMVQLRENGHA